MDSLHTNPCLRLCLGEAQTKATQTNRITLQFIFLTAFSEKWMLFNKMSFCLLSPHMAWIWTWGEGFGVPVLSGADGRREVQKQKRSEKPVWEWGDRPRDSLPGRHLEGTSEKEKSISSFSCLRGGVLWESFTDLSQQCLQEWVLWSSVQMWISLLNQCYG